MCVDEIEACNDSAFLGCATNHAKTLGDSKDSLALQERLSKVRLELLRNQAGQYDNHNRNHNTNSNNGDDNDNSNNDNDNDNYNYNDNNDNNNNNNNSNSNSNSNSNNSKTKTTTTTTCYTTATTTTSFLDFSFHLFFSASLCGGSKFDQAESDECRLKAQQAQELMKELKVKGHRIGQGISGSPRLELVDVGWFKQQKAW